MFGVEYAIERTSFSDDKNGNYILTVKGSLFYIIKAIIHNIPANSPRIDIRTGRTKPRNVILNIYAIIASSETVLKVLLNSKNFC